MSYEQRIDYPGLHFQESLFDAVVREASQHRGGKQWEPLEYLAGAKYPGDCAAVRQGATYKSLAYVAHRLGMNSDERQRWYRIAQRFGFSQAHVGIIIARLNERDAIFSDLDKMAFRMLGTS